MSERLAGRANPLPSSVDLQVHEVVHLPTTASTMDEAHARASRGAPAGTLIIVTTLGGVGGAALYGVFRPKPAVAGIEPGAGERSTSSS